MEHHKKLEAAGYNFVGGTKLGFKRYKDRYRNPEKEHDIVVTHKDGDVQSIYKGDKEHKNIQSALKEEVLSFKQFVEAAAPKGNFASKTSNLLGSGFKSERDSFGGQKWMRADNADNSHMPDLHKHLEAHGFTKHKTHRDGSIYLNGKREVEVLHQGNRVHSVELK